MDCSKKWSKLIPLYNIIQRTTFDVEIFNMFWMKFKKDFEIIKISSHLFFLS